MTWEWYQKRIAEFFRRVPGARVQENVKVDGKSGTKRQLDVQIFLPMQVELSTAIKVTVDIHIIVDAKKHERPVDIGLVGQINDLRDDVGAHLAIIASPIGFTEGARNRAPKVSVALLSVTADLLSMLDKVESDFLAGCQNYGCNEDGAYIDWDIPQADGETRLGSCRRCDVLHVLCPDCGSVFAVHEFDEGKPFICPGCPRIYWAQRDELHRASVEVRDELDVLLMTAANENQSKRISSGRVAKIVGRTKWQYDEDPTSNLTEVGLMEWTEDGEHLRLTEDGQEDYDSFIAAAEEAPQ
jgi:hypothetical protein